MQEKKYYLSKNIDLKIISPSKDNYNITPAKKIEKGLCDFGLCPTETLISFRTKNKKFDLVALMSIFQKDVSAIAVSEKSKINRPVSHHPILVSPYTLYRIFTKKKSMI